MLGFTEPGTAVYLTACPAPQRKLHYSWLLAGQGRNLVCVDTSGPNTLIGQAVIQGTIPQLSGYKEVVPEMPLGASSRCDFCLRVHESRMVSRCWVEVKAVTMARAATALFPDARTERGQRHLVELTERVRRGDRAIQLFVIQRNDCSEFRACDDIDPAYGQTLREAVAAGVELLAYALQVTKRGLEISRQVTVSL
jgi:sugar fermentation stimulation protein A